MVVVVGCGCIVVKVVVVLLGGSSSATSPAAFTHTASAPAPVQRPVVAAVLVEVIGIFVEVVVGWLFVEVVVGWRWFSAIVVATRLLVVVGAIVSQCCHQKPAQRTLPGVETEKTQRVQPLRRIR